MAGQLRECEHPRARHQHGTRMAFDADGCRCLRCSTASRRDRKRRRVARASGGPSRFVDPTRTRKHLEQLLADGLTIGQVATRSGIARNVLMTLAGTYPGRPASTRIRPATAAAVLAVTGAAQGPEVAGYVDGTGTRRRLRALVALGWAAQDVGDLLGWTRRNTWRLTQDGPLQVRISTRDELTELYDRLSMTPVPASPEADRARAHAARRGWLPPLAWDDDDIDNPTRGPADPADDDDLEDVAA